MPISDHPLRFFGLSIFSPSPRSAFFLAQFATGIFRLIVASFGIAVFVASASGQSCELPGVTPATGNELPDGVFLPDRREGETQVYRIQRVVGTGRASDYDADGFIRADRYDTYRQNGIVADTAKVQVGARLILNAGFQGLASLAGIDGAQAEIRFFLNGHPVGKPYALIAHATHNGTIVESFRETIEVPSSYLKFARLLGDEGGPCPVSVRDGETTCPGENRLYMQAKVSLAPWQPQYGTGLQPYVVDMVNFALNTFSLAGYQAAANKVTTMPVTQKLQCKAMSPVILIHGCCGEDPSLFGDGRLSDEPPKTFQDRLEELGHKCLAINLLNPRGMLEGDPKYIPDGVAERVPTTIRVIADAARLAGAKSVHLVAHSRGGFDARAYVTEHKRTLAPSKAYPVPLSLVTMSTPHRGTTLAYDALLFQHIEPRMKTALEMTPEGADKLDRAYPVPGGVMVDGRLTPFEKAADGSDANRDGSSELSGWKTLSLAEINGSLQWTPIGDFPTDSLKTFSAEVLYNATGRSIRVPVLLARISGMPFPADITAIRFVPFLLSTFVNNDLIVTVDSAVHSLPQLSNPQNVGDRGLDHWDVLRPRVADEVHRVTGKAQPCK